VENEPDITAEFQEWLKLNIFKADGKDFYELWELFLNDEYNDQRNW
jgi:hypothetical protein